MTGTGQRPFFHQRRGAEGSNYSSASAVGGGPGCFPLKLLPLLKKSDVERLLRCSQQQTRVIIGPQQRHFCSLNLTLNPSSCCCRFFCTFEYVYILYKTSPFSIKCPFLQEALYLDISFIPPAAPPSPQRSFGHCGLSPASHTLNTQFILSDL